MIMFTILINVARVASFLIAQLIHVYILDFGCNKVNCVVVVVMEVEQINTLQDSRLLSHQRS